MVMTAVQLVWYKLLFEVTDIMALKIEPHTKHKITIASKAAQGC